MQTSLLAKKHIAKFMFKIIFKHNRSGAEELNPYLTAAEANVLDLCIWVILHQIDQTLTQVISDSPK